MKSKYESHVLPKLHQVEKWAHDGLTLDQIAHNLGIARSTFFEYIQKYEDLSDTIKNAKQVADEVVENALYKNATGFYYEEDQVTNKGDIVRVRKWQSPNTTAQIFWLKNRRPAEWRDKQELEHSGPGGEPLTVHFNIPRPKVNDEN